MKQRFLMWGLASIAFMVTLAFSSWQEGLWPTEETPKHGNRAATLAATDTPATELVSLPAQPFGPAKPAPPAPVAVVAAPAAEALPPMPTAEAEVDTTELLNHRDRAAQHSARAR